MAEYDAFPDAEAIAGYAVRQAAISGVNGVYSSLPNTPNYPVIVIKRIGGIPRERHRLDRPRLQVEVWGTTKSEAHDIAQEARVALHEMEGQTYKVVEGAPVDAVVTAVEDDLGLAWMPDQQTDYDRYIFAVQATTHIP